MISLPSGTRIWLVAGVTDMRKSFNGLGELIQHTLDDNPFCGHLFIFRGRKGDTVKILCADADDLCLFTKRLPSFGPRAEVTNNFPSAETADWYAHSPTGAVCSLKVSVFFGGTILDSFNMTCETLAGFCVITVSG